MFEDLKTLTSALVVTCLVHFTLEQLQTHNGINGDHEEDQQCNVEEGQHGLQNRAHYHLEAWMTTNHTSFFNIGQRHYYM